jgi:hypothetical protein
VTFAGLKIWPLFIALGTAATAAGVTVWAAYDAHEVHVCRAQDMSPGENLGNGGYEHGTGVVPVSFRHEERAHGGPLDGRKDGDLVALAVGFVPGSSSDCRALRYARALQAGRVEQVISMTHWMQERLKRVQLSSSAPEDEETARAELRSDILLRTLEGNRLRPEGVRDKYIFAPGARFEVIGSDKRENGRDDPLTCPVKERTWLRVVYPNAATALRDEMGRPIRSIVVGVNTSPEGYVLKAGVLGNVEIQYDTISLDWGS